MGIRYRNATPGTILLLAATALLAIVSFNTPLLKTLYFLHAKFDSGEYSGDLYLGTLGYCLTNGGNERCEGPKLGYEFNPNTLFGISVFNIPQTITKYLTYTFILHIIALAAAAGSFVFGLLSHISTMSVWCFPTCLASIASSISLLALVFDLVIFYIAKARIDDVSGASASIGICVWLVLAAWLLAGFGGCAFGIGNCCFGSRNRRNSMDTKMDYYAQQMRSDDMRLQAMRDEQLRKKEQGLPSFQELERTPLTNPDEDKYLYEEQPLPQSRSNGGGLARDGSVLQGVGVGYGRRTGAAAGGAGGYAAGTFGNGHGGYETLQPPSLARRVSASSGVTAGNAGWGAGGQGVEAPEDPQQAQPEGYGGYYGNQNHNYYEGYNDPYQQRPYDYANGGQSYDPNYPQNSYDPNAQSYDRSGSVPPQGQYDQNFPQPVPSSSMNMPTPVASGSNNNLAAARYADPYGSNTSSESHYPDPGPRVSVADADPYGGYDDGLGGIGMAATSPNVDSAPASPAQGYGGTYAAGGYDNSIQVPQPQHLVSSGSQSNLLRSPLSPRESGEQGHAEYRDDGDVDAMGNRPPSYGQIAGATGADWRGAGGNEKSGYR